MPEITSRLSTALADRYKIERHVGEGGMATVYLAEDLKHKRKVAVKVLRPELAAVLGAERFVQEITTTANLQHPNILPLFDSGEADGFLFYVMPYIDGETLRDKLNRETQLGIDEAVKITTEVAEALDSAHRQGVIHRDIKPENILLHDGRPMVADFGIALAVSAAAGGRMTETGLSLGTPHYMSPEQATAEKDLTNRADIYSLGSVLYEMLTGSPPHVGSSAQQIIMKIVTEDVQPVTELRKSVPAHVAAATAQALEKLPADRFESSAKFAEALTNPLFTRPAAQAPAVPGARPTGAWNRLTVTLAVAAVLMTITTIWGWLRPGPPQSVSRFSVALPERERMSAARLARLAISPNGERFVYVGPDEEGIEHLWVRDLNALGATRLPGTEGARNPFFSPNGDRIGFFWTDGYGIKVASLAGGPPVTVTENVGTAGGSWGPNNHIYWSDRRAGGLMRASVDGGAVEQLTTPDSMGETSHDWPDALPNGRGVLFVIARGQDSRQRDIALLDLASGSYTVLLRGVAARYAGSGHILYVTADGALMVVPFDQDALSLSGEPFATAEGLRVGFQASVDVAVSRNGTLMYATGAAESGNAQLVWVSRNGAAAPIETGWWGSFSDLALSPDGGRLAMVIVENNERQIWIKELDRGPLSKLTSEGVLSIRPTWMPDGRSVVFSSVRERPGLYVRRADGSAPSELLLDDERPILSGTFSPDGEWLVYDIGRGPVDIHGVRLGRDTAAIVFVATDNNEASPALSPNGRWLAYTSDESGQYEVYVRPFPNTADAKYTISTDGGVAPRWAHSGRELFYITGSHLVSGEVETENSFIVRERQALFSLQGFRSTGRIPQYDVTRDDQRFVMIRNFDETASSELIVVQNFFEELKAKVGN